MKKFYDALKQAQKIQDKLKKTREDLAGREVEASSGGGVVKVVINGNKQLLRIEIDKAVVDPDDIDMLQDLVVSAVNSSMEKVNAIINEEVSRVTGGLPVPDLFQG